MNKRLNKLLSILLVLAMVLMLFPITASAAVTSDSKVTKPADPAKDGYTFVGLYTDSALTVLYDFTKNVTGSFTLYAGWVQGATSEMPINPFVDALGTDWFIDAVIYVYDKGLMSGTSTESMLFSPNVPLTRGMVATILWRMEDSSVSITLNIPFSDVAPGDWYFYAVKWAADKGIVSGYGDGTFGPGNNITRQDMCTVLYQFLIDKNLLEMFDTDAAPGFGQFGDAGEIDGYAREAVHYLSQAGIISGKPGNVFDPKGYTTRAEFAAVLMRFLEAIDTD